MNMKDGVNKMEDEQIKELFPTGNDFNKCRLIPRDKKQ